MSDNYQAVYDAVRSRMSNIYIDPDVIYSKFDISFAVEQAKQCLIDYFTAPSVLYKPKIAINGNKWCALYGENLQDGVAGFGDSPAEAMADFDNNWYKKLENEND